MINPFKKLEQWTKGGYTFGDLFEDIEKIPTRYAFHVKRGAGMIGGYAGETVGAGTRELFVKGVGGVKTGLWEGMITPKTTNDIQKGTLVDRWGSWWGERIPTYTTVTEDVSGRYETERERLLKTAEDYFAGFTEKGAGLVQFPEGFGQFDLSQLGLAEGMGAMGQGLATALSGMGPEMPEVPKLTDEEGKPNIPLLMGLGLAGVLLLKKV